MKDSHTPTLNSRITRSVLAEKQDEEKAQNTEESNGKIKANKPAPPPENITMLGSDIEIMCDQPMPQYDSGDIKAYAARLKSGKSCFALICENFLVPRTFLTSKFSQLANMNIVRIVASGVTFWPPEKRQRYVFVYEDTLGNKILPPDQPQAMGMKQERLMNAVIKPLVVLLLELRDADLIHGGIRATNIYDGNANNFENIILGEALSAPPTYHQPSIYMPIEKAICPPYARGISNFSDDIFALGVTILTLMRQEDPFADMREEEMVRQRVEHGTYSFFTTHQRTTGPLMELVRGLLHDDWQQRWTIEEVLAWMDGKRLAPKKQKTARTKAVRAFDYEGYKIIRPESFAYELQFNPKVAKDTIVDEAFETWIQRSLSNDKITTDFHDAKHSAELHGKDGNYPDRLLSKTITTLFPGAPIIYKNLKAMPEGVGYLAAYLFGNHANTQALEEIIKYNLVAFWAKIAEHTGTETQNLKQKFESAQANTMHKKLGFGVEGNLYYLCPEAPCLSPILNNYCVRSPEDLLMALDDLCAKTKKTDGFYDKHIISFLMARDKKVIESELMELNSFEVHKSKAALLKIFSNIQERAGMRGLPNLCRGLLVYLTPLLERTHDRKKKEELKKTAEGIADNGSIPKLERLINNKKSKKEDKTRFINALREYKSISDEQAHLEHQLTNNPKFGFGTGFEVAAIISGIITALVILAATFLQYSKGGIF